ncbi:MAG: alanine--tRNA ligase [Candidatus Aenigmatarchaeota archaeon]
MMDKKGLMKEFQKDWKRYWGLEWLQKNGFKRYHCKNCGKFFWSLVEQDVCNDSSCRPYEFLGKPVTKKKFDYFQAWDAIKRHFVKEGHVPLQRFPTVCRWYPLYFTIAGIVDFYRIDNGNLMFEFPANPSIMLQPCLRFNNIPNVGVTGRADTSFCMVQQSALWDGKQGYWKDKAIELDYNMLTKVFGIKPEKINFLEDVWLGAGAFGYSLEYHVSGVELGNCVFTEFAGTPDKYVQMKQKVIDMGAGLERFVWASSGAPTLYDATYGPVIDALKKKAGIKYDKDLFMRYSPLAGKLNFDDCPDVEAARADIAKKLGIDKAEMVSKIDPMVAIYSIADHAKTLLFAISDGGIPSNVGGGYNLRVVLRRALNFIEKYNFPFDVCWVAENVAQFLKPMFPELPSAMPQFRKIIDVEEKRYRGAMERTQRAVELMLEREEPITEDKLIQLYDSQGITPELVSQVASKKGMKVNIPAGFWASVADLHTAEKAEQKKEIMDTKGLPATRKLYFDNDKLFEFSANVLKIDGSKVVLDQTAFYPRGGGQEPDHGLIENCRVYDVENANNVIVHMVEEPSFKEGDTVKCSVNRARREQITAHHTATHLISGSARKIIGPWMWQEGSKKDEDKAHIDLAHYEPLMPEEVEKIEKMANDAVKKGYVVDKKVWDRVEAEKKFGFTIYQGAAVPSSKLKVCSIGDFEHEACGGTHVDNTKEIGQIVISKVERPTDGTVRIIYMAGKAAENLLKRREEILKLAAEALRVKEEDVPSATAELLEEWKEKRKEAEKLKKKKAEAVTGGLNFKKSGELRVLVEKVKGADARQLQEISKRLNAPDALFVLFGIGKEKISVLASVGEQAAKMGFSASVLVHEACKDLGGKGGGNESFAQGVGMEKNKLDGLINRMISELIR